MPSSYLPCASNSSKIRCWICTNWNLQLLIITVILHRHTCVSLPQPPAIVPKKEGRGVRCCTWNQKCKNQLCGERGLRFPVCPFGTDCACWVVWETAERRCELLPEHTGQSTLAFLLPHCTIGMETFALLEGSDKDGFLKFPFLSENERKMLF